jgi:tRNA(Ile2) C34 agmatinyltransferase TiaS
MQLTSRTTIVGNADVISGILNWVCPECGGRMGGRDQEFKCQGECLTDWRLIWSECFQMKLMRPKRAGQTDLVGKRRRAG